MLQVMEKSGNATLSQKAAPLTCQLISLSANAVLQAGDWVQLFVTPSEYANDSALLLCEITEERWLAWIPDHGEAELCLRQFCRLS